MNNRAKFDALRAAYLIKLKAYDEHSSAMRVKYGPSVHSTWLSSAERKKSDKLSAQLDAVGDKLFAHIQDISPRDWSYGVPSHWVLESLTYDDVVRPKSEPLSVTPPMAYGARSAMG